MHCFLGGRTCAQEPKHPKRSDCHYASTLEIRNTILRNCRQQIEEHIDNEWIDFVAAECYHASCYTRFSARKRAQEAKATKIGRKNNEEMTLLFEQTCMWLENDISIHLVQVFRKKMIEICKKEDKDKVYDARYVKKLLKNRHGDFIWFSKGIGNERLSYFKNMAENIIR